MDSTSRRRFLDWFLGTTAGALLVAVLYPAVRFVIPPEVAEPTLLSVTLSFGPADMAPNSYRIFKFGSRPGILIRTPGGDFRAFSATCTHLGCTVQLRPDLGRIWCACHDGQFDLNGQNVAGPPPRPLEAFSVNVLGDRLVVSRDS